MALQEMNLAYRFPLIYWNTACLSVDASAVCEEDFENLINEGMMSMSDDEDKRNVNKMDYGKIAAAITKFRNEVTMELPDINKSRLGFTPNVEDNTILYGLKGVVTMSAPAIEEILLHRPYISLEDFLNKVTKKIVNKSKVINLIKSGAFNNVEHDTAPNILKRYLYSTADVKQKLTVQNAAKLIEYNLIPKQYALDVKLYNLTKALRRCRDENKFYYIVSKVEVPEEDFDYDVQFLQENCNIKKIAIGDETCSVIDSDTWDRTFYEPVKNRLSDFIRVNQDQLLIDLNDKLVDDEWNKYVDKDKENFELDSIGFYYTRHPLTLIIPQLPVEISRLDELKEDELDGFFLIKNKEVPKMKLRSIVGTVIDRDTTKGLVSLQTPEGVIDIKLYKDLFATYNQTVISFDADGNKYIDSASFFDVGTHLLVTGILRGTTFIPKVYKNTGVKAIERIIKSGDKFIQLEVKE